MANEQHVVKGKSNQIIPVLIIGCLVLIGGVYHYANSLPNLPVDELLIDTPAFPNSWDSGEISVENIEWAVFSYESGETAEMEFWTSYYASRAWGDQENEMYLPQISESIYQYPSPILAMVAFEIFKPEIYYRYHRPNFHGDCGKGNCYPIEALPIQTLSDQQHLVCAMGNPNDCQEYFYWARYGQYVVEVRYFGPNQGMDLQRFAQVIASANQRVVEITSE